MSEFRDEWFCPCCHGYTWWGCRCDGKECECGRRRVAEGRDETDIEGDSPEFRQAITEYETALEARERGR